MAKHLALTLMAVLALGLTACKEEKTVTESTEESNVGGTEVERTTKTETTVDEEGRVNSETKSKTTVDPEGLMNKETTETESSHEEKAE